MDTNKGAGEEVISHGGKRETYGEFVEKFKPKKTTDDCMTPPAVYEAVADWVANEYGLDRADFVRPFWPGGDYTSFEYPDGCVVVDNPPFSLNAKILDYFITHGIKFFMFAPALMLRASLRRASTCLIACGAPVTYDNGAKVPTSFVTNLEGSAVLRTAPDLYDRLRAIEDERKAANAMPRYKYPNNLITAAMANQIAKSGISYAVDKSDCAYASNLDAMKAYGKGIYGGGLLLSEKAAAEKAAAEKKKAIVWELSDRERDIIANLGKPKEKNDDE